MNPIDLIREKLESCFIFCSYAAPEIRYELGIKHLSQVWTTKPCWYFWLEGVAGAFMVELQGGAKYSANGIDCKGAAGVVRYFPIAEYKGLLTDDEVELIAHGLFDATITPQWDQLSKIVGTDRFVAATIEIHTSIESDDLYFVFETTRPEFESTAVETLFERLVGMHAYTTQCKPAGPYFWGKHGRAAAFVSSGDGTSFLRDYLQPDQLVVMSTCDQTFRAWETLAGRKPMAAAGTGCCCCCH